MAKESAKPTENVPKSTSETDPSTNPSQKKRKKNARDRPQPAWLFPPDDENPVLNPKPKSEAQAQKEKAAKAEALDFLHHKSVGAPKKAPPPGLLLTLVGGFLSSYGFDGASRLFTAHCISRRKLQAWDHELGMKLPKGMPDLVRVFKEWYKEWELKAQEESSSTSSDEDIGDEGKSKEPKTSKGTTKTKKKMSKDSSTSGSDESSSEGDSSDSEQKKPKAPKAPNRRAKDGASTSSSSSSSSTSDSDADDEKPSAAGPKLEKKKGEATSSSSSSTSSDSDTDSEKEPHGAKLPPSKPTVNSPVKNLKRKASTSTSSSSVSVSSSSSSDDDVPPAKKPKAESVKKTTTSVEPIVTAKHASTAPKHVDGGKPNKAATSSSSEESTSESSSDEKSPARKPLPASSSSSGKSSSSSDSEAPAPTRPSEESKPTKTKLPLTQTSDPSKSSDSSVTLDGTVATKTLAETTTAITSPAKDDSKVNTKRKRSLSPHSNRAAMTPNKTVKKEQTSFQRVPKDTEIDPRLSSNKYVNYDYAERAHRDLSVMKGKGFMKEKNKKKKGSYRGGTIDVDGRKGIKFDN